jgi:hypothetical protein
MVCTSVGLDRYVNQAMTRATSARIVALANAASELAFPVPNRS